MKKLLHILIISLVIMLSLIVIAALTNAALKRLSPIYFCNTVSQSEYDNDLGVIAQSNFSKTILTDHIIEVANNDIGTRNHANKHQLKTYDKLIFCAGDSFTEGVGNMTDESYPFYLDLLLNLSKNEPYKTKYGVVNLGLGGYGSLQVLSVTERFAKIFDNAPDYVVYLICDNDPEDDLSFLAGMEHLYIVEGSPYYPGWVVKINTLFEYNQIYSRLKIALRNLKNLIHTPEVPVDLPSESYESQLEQNLPGLMKLIALSRRWGSKLIISYTGFDKPEYEALKDLAAKHNILFADYKRSVVSVKNTLQTLPTHHTHSGGHFRSWINYVIASSVAGLIESETIPPSLR